ncbi:MAG: succinyl-diaminopimelate desuccinylase [Pseudomonadota bacterium]
MSRSPTLDLTCELIARPSVTPQDEGCLDVIGSRLAALGFELKRIRSGEVDNLWACYGDPPYFGFAGHTDVVPSGPREEWHTDPFEPTIKDGLVYGRGAADMKGSLAAMVIAVEEFLREHPNSGLGIAFLLTSDEEGPATDGTIKIVEYLERENIQLMWCVVGEPSCKSKLGDVVRVGRRGSLNGHITAHGIQGHVAYPEKVRNPIHDLMPALAELSTTEWDQGNEYYPPTSFQISNINAGTGADNVVPGTAKVKLNFRFSTEQSNDGLREKTAAVLNRHGLNFTLEWHLSGNPFLTPGGELVEVVDAVIQEETGLKTDLSTGGGTSDGRFITRLGTQIVELGPVNESIHKVNECVASDDLEHLAVIYRKIMVGVSSL